MKYYQTQFNHAAPLPLTAANYPHGFTLQVRTEHGHTNFLTLSAEKFAPIMAAIIAAGDNTGNQVREAEPLRIIAEMRGGCLVSVKTSEPAPGVVVSFESVDYDNVPSIEEAEQNEDAATERARFEAISKEADALPVSVPLN